MSRPTFSRARFLCGAALLFVLSVLASPVSVAIAGPGYQLASPSSIALSAQVPIGLAVDQSTQLLYVAELSNLLTSVQPGQIEQLSPSGTPTAASPFSTGGDDLFTAVAVNPVTHGVYAYQSRGPTPLGEKGKSTMSTFSSSGVLGSSFFPAASQTGTLAADSSGRVFFPNSGAGSVQIFNSSGTLEGTLTCSGCPGGSFGGPGALAFDSNGKLYVVDQAGEGRVVRLAPSGGSYVYDATLQSGGSPVAVAVDTSNDDVLVGNRVGSKYHVIAYDSSGVAFDDFGTDLVTAALVQAATGQLAVNATTHDLYLSNPGGNNLWVFERIETIPEPTTNVVAPSPIGQTGATLRATVNPKGHVLTTCHFEYTDHADFLANGFANAESAPCPALVGNRENTTISAAASGLTPATDYDYRIQVGSFGGTDESGPQAFETLPPLAPEATTGAASAITKTTATLAGTVNPKGGTVSSCRFEYVTEAGFVSSGFSGASSKACATTPSGNVAAAVSAKVTGLTAGTTYRVRVVATNNSGTGTAVDKAFATVAETCAENSALCPPSPGPSQPAEPVTVAPPLTPASPAPKPLKCRKGFKKKRVRGKLKCVRLKKPRSKR
ncbi:MAG TPA: hypothetical protein VFT10_06450 [Solirubrobacterales bacterium]|nr:hypothetical protein [Solirubrobacterales bacterium]